MSTTVSTRTSYTMPAPTTISSPTCFPEKVSVAAISCASYLEGGRPSRRRYHSCWGTSRGIHWRNHSHSYHMDMLGPFYRVIYLLCKILIRKVLTTAQPLTQQYVAKFPGSVDHVDYMNDIPGSPCGGHGKDSARLHLSRCRCSAAVPGAGSGAPGF